MQVLKRMLSRRWILTTLLVLVAMGVMIRLGIWQLDRLEKRRLFNARVQAQLDQPPLELSGDGLNQELTGMEYRQVLLTGEYDHAHEIALRNQSWGNQWGVHLITPLRIAGTDRVVLVDRGWIPAQDYESGDWSKFAEPGIVQVRGMIRLGRDHADFGKRSDPVPAPGEPPLKTWNFVNIEGITGQMPYLLLPVYVQQAPDSSWTGLPYRSLPKLELTEGPHMGYALQWFTFALILGLGYPFFIQRQERRKPQSTAIGLPGDSEASSQAPKHRRFDPGDVN
jgi:surfeit locus 1 family protein